MIISTEYKIIYLSNCKCASSCIRQRFMPINNKKLVEEVEKNFNHNPHAPYNKVKKYLLEKHSINTNKFFLFSTIRNPWERVVSLYKYAKPDKNGVPFWADKFGVERIEVQDVILKILCYMVYTSIIIELLAHLCLLAEMYKICLVKTIVNLNYIKVKI